jgi:hypothetical protein
MKFVVIVFLISLYYLRGIFNLYRRTPHRSRLQQNNATITKIPDSLQFYGPPANWRTLLVRLLKDAILMSYVKEPWRLL